MRAPGRGELDPPTALGTGARCCGRDGNRCRARGGPGNLPPEPELVPALPTPAPTHCCRDHLLELLPRDTGPAPNSLLPGSPPGAAALGHGTCPPTRCCRGHPLDLLPGTRNLPPTHCCRGHPLELLP
ncbi:hypothetical protein DR999_PMT18908 [Platysternon megacephalum]|uniref:Uncharacterized protein n=1 Tax=Platysternon megacephalum TaxID=55544 RepID=A0A4D9DS16_9SAUR|nr:hypothetical protein DR999_PMT18908 [Platysternon megacephalum]